MFQVVGNAEQPIDLDPEEQFEVDAEILRLHNNDPKPGEVIPRAANADLQTKRERIKEFIASKGFVYNSSNRVV